MQNTQKRWRTHEKMTYCKKKWFSNFKSSESLIVIFLPWYNCCLYVLNGNKMFLNWNWIELNIDSMFFSPVPSQGPLVVAHREVPCDDGGLECRNIVLYWQVNIAQLLSPTKWSYRKISNIRRTSAGNTIADHSDVVGASPVGAAPTTSSFST